MNKTNTLTVVIPTNRTQFLNGAINSVIKQEGLTCEIIVVDDGADPPIKDQLGNSFPAVRYVRHPKNLGLPASRNTGAKWAKSKFVTFLDCDDLLEPNFAMSMVSACEKRKVKVVVCLPHYFFSKNFPINRKLLFFCLNLIRDLVLVFCYLFNNKNLTKDGFFLVQSSHVIFEKKLLDLFPSDESFLTAANDWKLMAQILAQEKVAILPRRLSQYRYHYQSQSQSKNKISKWDYYDRLISEVPKDCRKGFLFNLFKMYRLIGRKFFN